MLGPEDVSSVDSDEFEYYVGLYMASNIKDKLTRKNRLEETFVKRDAKKLTRQISKNNRNRRHPQDDGEFSLPGRNKRQATIPRPPRLRTKEKNGERQYSSFGGRICDGIASDESQSPSLDGSRDSISLGPRSFDTNNSQLSSKSRVKIPQSSRLKTMEKNGERASSMNSNTRQSFDGNSYGTTGSLSTNVTKRTIPRPPRLRTMEKNGERVYSAFASRSTNGRSLSPLQNRPRFVISRAPRLRTMERYGERLYSSSSPLKKGTIRVQLWNGTRHRPMSVTVPVPFNLSTSPLKFSERKASLSHRKYTFRALPIPDFSYHPVTFNYNRAKISTIPKPFHLSKSNRRARSHSPLTSRKSKDHTIENIKRVHLKLLAPATNSKVAITSTATNGSKFDNKMNKRKKNIIAPSLTRRHSTKSKHRLTAKKPKRVFKRYDTNSLTDPIIWSVNPNLNASRIAKRNHMLQVAAEVARLREEWRLYKEEAERALADIERSKRERKQIKIKLSSIATHDNEHDVLQKQLKKLKDTIKLKSKLYKRYKQQMIENERQQKLLSFSVSKRSQNEIPAVTYANGASLPESLQDALSNEIDNHSFCDDTSDLSDCSAVFEHNTPESDDNQNTPKQATTMQNESLLSHSHSNDDDHSSLTKESEEQSSEKSAASQQKEFRPKGDFGDDFEVSSLTNLFRGGWHRALSQGNLSLREST
jgi:hypothetical protein